MDLSAPAHTHRHSLRLRCILQVISVMKAHVGSCAFGSQTSATITLGCTIPEQVDVYMFFSVPVVLFNTGYFVQKHNHIEYLTAKYTYKLSRKRRCDA